VVAPLDAIEGARYTEPVNDDAHNISIKNIYNMTGRRDYYVNLTADGELSWRGICSVAESIVQSVYS